jgi:hypothetical protein
MLRLLTAGAACPGRPALLTLANEGERRPVGKGSAGEEVKDMIWMPVVFGVVLGGFIAAIILAGYTPARDTDRHS